MPFYTSNIHNSNGIIRMDRYDYHNLKGNTRKIDSFRKRSRKIVKQYVQVARINQDTIYH